MPKENYPVTLIQIDEMSPTVRNFHFEFKKKARFDFKAGQFVTIELVKNGKNTRKSYSIASPPYLQNKIELCIKLVDGGFTSNWFFNLKVGDEITIQGPLGAFALNDPLPAHLIFAATGTGIAPLRAQARQILHNGDKRKISMILGVRHEEEILFEEEMRSLEKQYPNFEFIPVISRPKSWKGETGYVQDVIRRRFSDPKDKEVYICGLVPMVNDLKATLSELGYSNESIHFEKWT